MDIQTKTDIIHQKIYDFLLYIYPLLTKYPKYEKLLRLAHDLKYSAMNARHYGESCRKLKEIGVMLGELIEEVKTRK